MKRWIRILPAVPKSGIVADFLSGLSIVGLARKYGRTRLQIEATLRRAL